MVIFEWNLKRAESNRAEAGVSFHEAASVFGDPLSVTYPDLDQPASASRYTTIGSSAQGLVLVIAHTEHGGTVRILRARAATERESEVFMKEKAAADDELRPEYDFTEMKGGLRGKFAGRFDKGSNLVLLEPELARSFPSDEAVNDALRAVLKAAEAIHRPPPSS